MLRSKRMFFLGGFTVFMLIITIAFAQQNAGESKEVKKDIKSAIEKTAEGKKEATLEAKKAEVSRESLFLKEGKPQTLCAVCGKDIKKTRYNDIEGRRVYFCSNECRKEFKANPDQYLKKQKEEGIAFEAAPKEQATCPACGMKLTNKNISESSDDKKVYFCSNECAAKMKKDPKAMIEKLKDNGEYIERVQTYCPVMGKPIDKKFFADYEGKRVYFCCGACPAKFNEKPKEFIDKLEKSGITLDKTPASK